MESRTTDPDTPMATPVISEETRAAAQRIAVGLAQIDFVLPGTITQRMRRCGKSNCRCAQDPQALHGPYIQWTRTMGGKTVTKQLSAEQLARYRPWLDNARRLRELLGELETLSLDAIRQAEGWGAKS